MRNDFGKELYATVSGCREFAWFVLTLFFAFLSLGLYFGSAWILVPNICMYLFLSYGMFRIVYSFGVIADTSVVECSWSLFGLFLIATGEKPFLFAGKYCEDYIERRIEKFRFVFGLIFLYLFFGYTLKRLKEEKDKKKEEC